MKHAKTSLALSLSLAMLLPTFSLARSLEPEQATLLAAASRPENPPHDNWKREQREREREQAWREQQRDREEAWRNKHRDKNEAWHRENRYENSDERRQDEQRHQREEEQHSRDNNRDNNRDGQHRP